MKAYPNQKATKAVVEELRWRLDCSWKEFGESILGYSASYGKFICKTGCPQPMLDLLSKRLYAERKKELKKLIGMGVTL